ncbi:hypothetical protein FE633_18515 [Streptomyces montanus]|uniref:Uncharacterized protein n=1 Tax=Streptomyces montanus TaxID=2580423 RepID=A0A5R9FSH4_9ACTN|nr:hypothetical protein [Streptomyces montanus]TLS44820.1 hypothetical protein FE633_18515 [Streptomyces montanus]
MAAGKPGSLGAVARDVRLKATPQQSGVWVAAAITNHGDGPADYEVTVRVTGPGGFSAEGKFRADRLAPEAQGGGGLLFADRGGAPVPTEATATVVDITRRPTAR